MTESGALATLPDPTLVEEKAPISFRFPRKTWIAIGVASLVAGIMGVILTLTVVPEQYRVTRTLLVFAGSNPNDNDTLIRSFQDIMGQKSFALEIKARTGSKLSTDEISGMISADRPPLTAEIQLSVTAPNIKDADTVSAAVVPVLEDLLQRGQANLAPENRIPGPIVHETYPNPTREVVYVPWWFGLLTGAGLAFLVGFIVAAFRQYRTPVIASARDVGDALDLPVLARINAVGDGKGANPQDSVLGMLSAIERLGARGPIHRLVVVGPSNDLERSKLVLALGCAIARNFDQPVALIDADLEHSSLTKLIGATDEPGLAECLAGDLRVDQTLLRLENGHTPQILNGMVPPSGMIRVMPAGVNRGGSLLRMRSNLHQVLGALSGRYVVVIDGPQVPGPVPVSSLLSLSDATIVVVTEGSTSIREARFTGDALRSATTNPVGAVVLKK
jgi:Mrp family chromosome partitioning ATPase